MNKVVKYFLYVFLAVKIRLFNVILKKVLKERKKSPGNKKDQPICTGFSRESHN